MKLYKTNPCHVVEIDSHYYPLVDEDWDLLVNRDDLFHYLQEAAKLIKPMGEWAPGEICAPVGNQEIWAAGVTYTRSKTARMEESKASGGGSFYDRVYDAPRPELFFKSSLHRTAGDRETVRIRKDSKWNIPEPELTLVVTCGGKIIGYTIGNDMCSRDIEGENPLYLPQAKVYNRSCAIGPCIYVSPDPLPKDTEIHIRVARGGDPIFEGSNYLSAMKRDPEELVEFLFREDVFPKGCLLLTGTGVVPPDDFTLQSGDEIAIRIEPIGTLTNVVE